MPAHHRSRGARLCDNCGAFENPAIARFRLCGGCMITQYCSPECQRTHWNSHRAICQHTVSQISATQQYAESGAAKNLRKFCSTYQDLIGWAAFQALALRRCPSNIRNTALIVDLEPPRGHRANFNVAETYLVERQVILAQDKLVTDDILRREERCRRAGGLGAIVVLIQCGDISQVMPIEVDPPSKIVWDHCDNWEHVFRNTVAGRMHFASNPAVRVPYH